MNKKLILPIWYLFLLLSPSFLFGMKESLLGSEKGGGEDKELKELTVVFEANKNLFEKTSKYGYELYTKQGSEQLQPLYGELTSRIKKQSYIEQTKGETLNAITFEKYPGQSEPAKKNIIRIPATYKDYLGFKVEIKLNKKEDKYKIKIYAKKEGGEEGEWGKPILSKTRDASKKIKIDVKQR